LPCEVWIMAPPTLRGPVTRAKENRAPPDAISSKGGKDPGAVRPQPRRAPLSENRPAPARPAAFGGAAKTSPRTVRSVPDPWAEVRVATAEADKLEVELAGLEGELQVLDREVAEAETREREAEEQLTSQSAMMLSEYATAYERFRSLEEQLRNVREGLSARRKENLELSRKNLELDRTAKSLQEKIAEATTELERCSRSQGELDAAVAEGLQACDAEKAAAEIQSQRLARDLNRFTCMKAKLQELLVASDRPQEVLRLLAEAEALATRTALALAESREVAEKGIVPMEESSAPFPEAAS